MTVLAATAWNTNADMILACVELGYLRKEWLTLDSTYGRGTWWKKWEPDSLEKVLGPGHYDFRELPTEWAGRFDAVTFDPPYKLNGRPTAEVDDRYGVGERATVDERHMLIREGIHSCHRALRPGGLLLLKCQDQVCSGRVHWQTHIFTGEAMALGMRLVDSLLMLGGREQPPGRRQVHARRNYSTLLVLQKAK